jgi:CBS domain-containing protein
MWDHDCGCLPVCGGDGATRVVGVITDRDICMHALFQSKPLQELRVSEGMAKQVQVCRPGGGRCREEDARANPQASGR